MTESLMITIYIALIVGSIAAIVMIALQVAIFIYLQNVEFNFEGRVKKIKNFFTKSFLVFMNPGAEIKSNKTDQV